MGWPPYRGCCKPSPSITAQGTCSALQRHPWQLNAAKGTEVPPMARQGSCGKAAPAQPPHAQCFAVQKLTLTQSAVDRHKPTTTAIAATATLSTRASRACSRPLSAHDFSPPTTMPARTLTPMRHAHIERVNAHKKCSSFACTSWTFLAA